MNTKKILAITLFSLVFAACGNNKESISDSSNSQVEKVQSDRDSTESSTQDNTFDGETISITDNHGEVRVPKNPKRLVALDSRTFDLLERFEIKPIALPKEILPASSSYKDDEAIENIGNHREPNLEVLAAVDPDLVIVGQRFATYYEDIKELVPNASVIDIDVDVSEEAASPGENLIAGYLNTTQILGEIFEKEDKADEIIGELEEALENASKAYKGESVMGVIVSGSEIGYSAPSYGRVWGPIFDILDLKPALEVDRDSSDHKGDDISIEAIAESRPEYLLVLDRDAATSDADQSQPAEDVIENSEALADLDVIKEGNIYYAPKDTYTNESIITLTEILNGLAELFSK